MDSKEIFRALQTGAISPENAEKELMKMVDPQPVVNFYEIEPGIIQVTMQDREHKNTFSMELVLGLTRAFEAIQADPCCKAVILTGYDSYFASGGTQDALLAIWEGKAKFTDTSIYSLGLDCRVPVIAAMQGHAIGAGWSMGMFCDFIVMSRESVYTSNYMKYGFTPGAGATLIFPEKFGRSLAQEILFTAKEFHGSELEEKGIPFPVLQRKEVLPYAVKLARKLSEFPRESLIALKDNMVEAIRERVSHAYEKELKMHERTFVNQPEVKDRIQSLFLKSSDNIRAQRKEKTLAEKLQEEKSSLTNIDPSLVPQKKDHVPQDKTMEESIAIIGMSGQFPKAENLDVFWDNLAQGVDCISEVPTDRWPVDEYYDPDPDVPGKTYCKWLGTLEDADKFDPLFFNISRAEAELMDPQQRLFLENCWHCIEDAGLNPYSLSESRCGAFVGCVPGDYWQYLDEQRYSAPGFVGMASSILTARISYLLNLKGPCLAIDTACSSSLVAIAEACNSLILHTCDIALAGGVSILVGPSMHIMSSKAGMLSKDGRCFTFDNRANGFVPGEGAGVILLKRLSDAVCDKDHIYGVIRGWGTNQDGKTNGITAPSTNSQILLEKEVYQRFGINPETISLIEAHGTGTKLGDPIEVEALTEAFRSFTERKSYCALGSVKTNIGHLLAAAGVAGVIKVLLALQNRMLPPSINFEAINKHVEIDGSPFYVNTTLREWETAPETKRCAAVSAFGFSGTNAHIVIEEYLPVPGTVIPVADNTNIPLLFVLSAKSEEQLKTYARSMKDYLKAHKSLNLADMAYTLQVGREAMDYRLAVLACTEEELKKALADYIDGNHSSEILTARAKKNRDGATEIEMDKYMESLIQNRKLDKIAELWVKGAAVDWDRLCADSEPHRISLPAYPFARERYWLAKVSSRTPVNSVSEAVLSPSSKGQSAVPVPHPVSKAGLLQSIKEMTKEERHRFLLSYVEELVAKNLRAELDMEDDSFVNMGLDSLVAINMRNQIISDLGIEVTMVQFMDDLNASSLTDILERQFAENVKSILSSSENCVEKAENAVISAKKANDAWVEI